MALLSFVFLFRRGKCLVDIMCLIVLFKIKRFDFRIFYLNKFFVKIRKILEKFVNMGFQIIKNSKMMNKKFFGLNGDRKVSKVKESL